MINVVLPKDIRVRVDGVAVVLRFALIAVPLHTLADVADVVDLVVVAAVVVAAVCMALAASAAAVVVVVGTLRIGGT